MNKHIKWWWQRRVRGFDDRELWSLDYTIAKYALPRLKRFKDTTHGTPYNLQEVEWQLILADIIRGLEYLIEDDYYVDEYKQGCIRRGIDLFGNHFNNLWD